MISMANRFQIISKGVVLFILLFYFNEIHAADGGPCKDYGECDKFQYSLNDIESLQRGASTYINYCYGCHSLKYSRWGRVAKDLQIPEDIFFENLVFDKSIKPGDLMVGAMPEDSANWFGVEPPDLTLVSRYKGDDWIYSYLRAYYEDSSKQYGVNNLVYPGTAMPNVLLSLQGNQRLVCKDIPKIAQNGGEKRDNDGNTIDDPTVVQVSTGSSLEVTKTAVVVQNDGNSTNNTGDIINYSIIVRNTGSVDISNITLTDTLTDGSSNTLSLNSSPTFLINSPSKGSTFIISAFFLKSCDSTIFLFNK